MSHRRNNDASGLVIPEDVELAPAPLVVEFVPRSYIVEAVPDNLAMLGGALFNPEIGFWIGESHVGGQVGIDALCAQGYKLKLATYADVK